MPTAAKLGVTTYSTPSDREVVVTRVVDAPRGLVFEALSTSQFVSLIVVPLAIVMLVLLRRGMAPTRHTAAQRVAA